MRKIYNKLFGYSEEGYLDSLVKDHGNLREFPYEEVESLINNYRRKSRWQKIGAGICAAIWVPAFYLTVDFFLKTYASADMNLLPASGGEEFTMGDFVMANVTPLAFALGLFDHARDNSKKCKKLEQELMIRSLDGTHFVNKKEDE